MAQFLELNISTYRPSQVCSQKYIAWLTQNAPQQVDQSMWRVNQSRGAVLKCPTPNIEIIQIYINIKSSLTFLSKEVT